jgi:hypothetical protein
MSGAVVKFKHDFALNKRVDLAPPCAKFLKACGLEEATFFQDNEKFTTNSRGYIPSSTKDAGETICGGIVYQNAAGVAIVALVKGMMGSFTMETEKAGHFPVLSFEFKGALVGMGDKSVIANSLTLPSEAFDEATIPPTYKAAVVNADGVHQYFGKFSFDQGNNVETLDSAAEATAIEASYISKREAKLSWDNLARLEAIDAQTQYWREGTEFEIEIETSPVGVIDEDIYDAYDEPDYTSVIKLEIFRGQIMQNKPADMKGAFAFDREVSCHSHPDAYDQAYLDIPWAITIIPTEIV